jgi:hypothetical protein
MRGDSIHGLYAYTLHDPAEDFGPHPSLLTRARRGFQEETAAELTPDFELPKRPIPHRADLRLLTGALNLMAASAGSNWDGGVLP